MSAFKKYEGKVVTVVTITGEIICRLSSADEQCLYVISPRLFVPGEQGSGFAPGISMTGVQNPDDAPILLSSVISVQICHPDVAAGWTKITSGLIVT